MGPVLLAAYGTLMTGQRNGLEPAVRSRLRDGRPCLIRGRLYEVREPGDGGGEAVCPALVACDDAAAEVQGELFAVGADPDEAARVLVAIDRYEECVPDDPDASTYVRRQRPVRADGLTVQAWVYLYNRPVDRLRPIPGGRWARPA